MKKHSMVLGLFCLTLLTACGGQDNAGENEGQTSEPAKIQETGEKISEESNLTDLVIYEKVPYRIYPTSANAWVGDVMPMEDDDGLQLFYLYDTDHNGPAYHPIYSFSTTNFYEYQDNGLTVPYGNSPDDPDYAIGTGSVLKAQDGRYHCFYTGHNDSFPEKGIDKECVMHAVSDDRISWTKIPEDTFYSADNYSGDDFRDPFVFWNEEEQQYWLLIAARENELGGIVARYVSDDLSKWTLCDPLYAPEKQYMLECPDLFRMGDKYYLFYSWDCVTYYAMSDSIYGPFTTPENNVLDGTGFCFYAAKTAAWQGNRYLCGWVGRKNEAKDTGNYNWAGSMLIHQLVQKADGTLGVCMPESLEEYFCNDETLNMVGHHGNVEQSEQGFTLESAEKDEFTVADLGVRRGTMLLECDVVMGAEGYAGYAFGEGEEYNRYTGMVLDARRDCVHYEGCVLPRVAYSEPGITTDFDFETGQEYHVKLVMENEIIVLYINGEKALSNRVYKSIDGAHFGLFVNEGKAEFRNVKIKTPQ